MYSPNEETGGDRVDGLDFSFSVSASCSLFSLALLFWNQIFTYKKENTGLNQVEFELEALAT